MRMQDEKVIFIVFKAIKIYDSDNVNDCIRIYVIDELDNNVHVDICHSDLLEFMLLNYVNTLDEVHDAHLGTHIHAEKSLTIEMDSSINRDLLVD